VNKNLVIILIVIGMVGYTIFSDDAPAPSPSQSVGSGGTGGGTQSAYAERSMEIAQEFLSAAPRHPTLIDAVGSWGASADGDASGLDRDLLRRNYYIIFDGSGSMNDDDCAPNSTKAEVARDALTAFVDGMPADANIGLYAFDRRGAMERVPLGGGNLEQVRSEVSRSDPSGSTPLGRSLVAAVEALSVQARRQLGYGEYHIVVITDGQASDEQAMNQMVDYVLANTPITIHTVGFCIEGDHALNRPGRLVYRPAGNPEELRRGLEQVLAETEDFNAQSFE
jgi:Ca-activated chloride channel family protein